MFISYNQEVAKQQILDLADSKNIAYKPRKSCLAEDGIKREWYEFEGGQLILENHNHGRSEIGLLTTLYNIKNDINIHYKLKWQDTFRRSTSVISMSSTAHPIVRRSTCTSTCTKATIVRAL